MTTHPGLEASAADRSPLEHDHPHRSSIAAQTQQQVEAFQVHAVVFAAAMAVMFSVNLLTNLNAGIAGYWSAWWSAWALIGWGTGLATHGLVLRLALWSRAAPRLSPRTR